MIKIKFINFEKHKDLFGIYKITNTLNNKVYIGQTRQPFKKRFWHHSWKLKNNTHDNYKLQEDWNELKPDNFIFEVLEIVSDVESLDSLEIKYISEYKLKTSVYNITDGGQGEGKNVKPMSEKAKRIIGEKNRKHMLGRKHTEETKRKMSEVRKGKRISKKTDVLTPELVKDIKNDLINGMTIKDASLKYDVTYNAVNGLVSNNTWSNVEVEGWENFLQNRNKAYRLTKEDHENIKSLSKQGMSKYELADMYNKNVKTIEWILRKK